MTSGRPCLTRHAQRGNALAFALLGLAITALTAVMTLRATRVTEKQHAGIASATILDNLRNSANAMISEQVVAMQAGSAITKNAVTVTPTLIGADLVWTPTIPQLAAMGYLPPGWTATTSVLNGAAYSISIQRVPTGCAAAMCGIEGHVFLNGAINDTATAGQFDGVVVGPILTRIGADSGVSLPASAGVITGAGNTWTTPNPVAGSPPGVVAVRIGTASAGLSQFVRISDTRDPDLRGNLTVAGNVSFGGTTTLKGAAALQNAALNVNAADGTNCVQILPSGTINISCAGALNARTGNFTDGAGNTTSITPGTLSTTGDISGSGRIGGNRLLPTGNYTPGSACTDNNAIAGNAVSSGLVLCSSSAWRVIVTQSAVGQACTPEGLFAQQDGVALMCRGGVYVTVASLAPTATTGQTCTPSGATAIDTATGTTVLCKANPSGGPAIWYRIQDMTSNRQFVASMVVVDAQTVVKPVCGSSAGYTGQPAVVVTPATEGSPDGSFNRYAVDNGNSWTVYLRTAAGTPLAGGTAMVQTLCYYP